MINIDPTTKAGRVIAYHLDHPEQTRDEIAEGLDFHDATVRTIVLRYHLPVPSAALARIRAGVQLRKTRFKRRPYAGQVSGGDSW